MASAQARYDALAAARSTVLERARDAARLTIPGIIPDDGQNEHTIFKQPYQSVGARGVASLASHLLLALFPPNLPFFRLSLDEEVANALGQDLGQANEKLAQIGRTVLGLMEGNALRTVLMEVLRHLIVAGNVLLHVPLDGKNARLFRLDQYVVKRDAAGRYSEIIVKEEVDPSTLSPEVRTAVSLDLPSSATVSGKIAIYTRVTRANGQVQHYQEIKGKEVPGSRGGSPEDVAGWFPLRWLVVPGSDYGRGHVTEVIGDLMSLEDLTMAMVKFAAEASRILRIVDPNAGIDVEELASAETGDFLTGYRDRIQTLQLEKSQDWLVMNQLAERIEKRVENSFLISSGQIRDAERVTAEEVRLVAQELETVLGGTYTVLSAELQLPLTNRYLYIAGRRGVIPRLPKTITPKVVTGFDALGRGAAVNRLRAWLGDLQATFGNGWQSYARVDEIMHRLGEGVEDVGGMIKSADELQADQQNAALAEAGRVAAPQIAKAAFAEAPQQSEPA